MANGTCKYEGCGTTGRIHLGWCVGHYTRWKRTGDLGGPTVAPVRVIIPKGSICSVATCDEPTHCRTWCKAHHSRWEKTGDVRAHIPVQRGPRVRKPKPPLKPKPEPRFCVAPDCGEPYYVGGYCIRHNYHVKRYGSPDGGVRPLSDLVLRTRHLPIEERFWARVDRDGPLPPERPDLGPCWLWLAGLNTNGYGQFDGVPEAGALAHRVAWVLFDYTLIAGLELDHLCRESRCVRPSHLEQVPKLVNMMRGNGWSGRNARKTHCSNGHAFTPANTRRNKAGHRTCLECQRLRDANRRKGLTATDLRISASYRALIASNPCHYCGGPSDEIDHFYPVRLGGTDIWVNLVAACFACNNKKAARCGTWFILRSR